MPGGWCGGTTPDAPLQLEQLQDGLRHPVFPLYLGRKSHPLALPLAPLLLEGNASDTLRNAYQQYQDHFRKLKVSLPKLQDECWWEWGKQSTALGREQKYYAVGMFL